MRDLPPATQWNWAVQRAAIGLPADGATLPCLLRALVRAKHLSFDYGNISAAALEAGATLVTGTEARRAVAWAMYCFHAHLLTAWLTANRAVATALHPLSVTPLFSGDLMGQSGGPLPPLESRKDS